MHFCRKFSTTLMQSTTHHVSPAAASLRGNAVRVTKTQAAGLATALLVSASSGAIMTYTQDFDAMGPSGTALPLSWQAGYLGAESSSNRLAFAPYAGNTLSLTNMPVIVNDGTGALPTPNVGTVFNLGLVGDSNRALGGYPRTTPSGDHIYQVALVNTTGEVLSEISLTFAGEQWNQSQGTSSSGPEMLRVLASSSSPTDGFLHYPSHDFTAPQQGPGGNVPLNGNDAANRVVISGMITLPAPVAAGATFYVRWHDWNDNGTSDHFLGIDDITITGGVPEPSSTAALLALGAWGLGRRRRAAHS